MGTLCITLNRKEDGLVKEWIDGRGRMGVCESGARELIKLRYSAIVKRSRNVFVKN